MSSATPSETETLLTTSPPDNHPSPKADGGRDIPVFIDSFKRNVVTCKTLIGLGLAGSLGVEIWCLVMSFVQNFDREQGINSMGNYLLWEKIANFAGVVLTLTAVLFYLISLGRHPSYDRSTGQFRNIDLHKLLTELNFVLIMTVLILHYLPSTLHTYFTRLSPPSPYSPSWVPWLRSSIEGLTLIVIGSMRRIPQLHYTPMKMGTGFGVNSEPGSSKRHSKKEESNVIDRAGCPIIEFVLLIYVARILKRSMTSQTLVLDDLPHLAEEVRKTGYRDALSEKQGTIQLDEDADGPPSPPRQKQVTSWQLVRAVWQGRGWVVMTNVVYEAVPQLFGLLQLVALRELIDSFADGPEGDKSYAYLMCALLLIGQCAEVIVSSICWVREHYLLHLPVRMVLASVLFSKILRTTDARALEAKKDADEASKKQGRSQVMNLLTIDTGAIASLGTYVWSITNSLVNLVVGFWLLYSMLGVSAVVGIGCIPLLSSLTTILAKFIYYCDKSLARARDTRTGAVKEFLSGIKVIKLNNFEDYYVRDITRVREAEVNWQRYRYTLGTLWNVIADQLPVISILVTFVFHTKVFGRNLDASTAFVALTVFNRVKGALSQLPSTLQALLQAKVSLDRLTAYMNQPEIDPPCDDSGGRIICDHVTIGWPSAADADLDVDRTKQSATTFTLKDVDLEAPQGQMTIVCGSLGSGKTLFLRGLLGEARVLKGNLLSPRTAPDAVPLNGSEIQRNWTNESWLIDSVAYAPQQAFIRHGTIRDNICFGQPFWKDRYKEALRQSALLSDLDLMESGDMTEVGEQGTTLSGGQKARVNLARCIYSRAKTVYMDDILSAVDAHTAQFIFTECFQGSLLKGRTFVLVTHHVALCLPAAEFLIVLDNGSVAQACPASEAQISAIPAAPPKPDEGPTEEKAQDDEEQASPVARQIYKAEHLASGRVASSHYWLIFKSVGGFWYWLVFAILFVVTRLADIGQSVVLEQWSSDTDPRDLDRNLINYGVFVSAAVILGAFRWVWLYGIGNTGFVNSMSRKIHAKLLTTLVHAPLSFFETTPTGRLMNIFGQDINRIDAFVSDDVGRTIMATLEVFTSILIVCIQTPIMAIFILVGSLPFYWLSGVLGKVRAELRRLSAVAGSPLITLYHDAIDGVVMIRAFGSNELMQASMLALINRERNATIADFAVFNWVRAIVQTITSIIVAGTGFALVRTDLSPSQAGFILSFAITASRGLFTLLERYSSLEQTFVSAERVEHYINGPAQEPTAGVVPETSWPKEGSIQIENFSVRYGPDLPDVLHDVSFTVEPGQRVGLVGATGSGKSTMALSLFRAIEGHEGRIVIDGHDISQINLHELRKRLNMVAQDGSLGSGTLRDALDITRTKDDYEIYEALRRVHLLPENLDEAELKGNPFASLETFVAVEGANFSAGEKQLLCLARALLKKSKILVMDEATSSVDFEMDSKITQTIKECFAGTTMLVIAHRLATIMHYDRVLVLDKGRVLEYGKPVDLMRNHESAFHGLCMAQGEEEYEKLLGMASEAE